MSIKGVWLLINAVIFSVSCATPPPTSHTAVASSVELPAPKEKGSAYPVFVRQVNDEYLQTIPSSDHLVIVGISGFHGIDTLMSDGSYRIGQESVEAALLDAARKLAMYEKATAVTAENKMDIGMSIFDYVNDSSSSVEPAGDYAVYMKDFEFEPEHDIFVGIKTQTVFVRVRYSSPDIPFIDFTPSMAGSRPSWITNPPETIAGFSVGVGFANPRVLMKEAIISSYENAACDLAWRRSVAVNANFADAGVDSRTNIKVVTNVSLHKFYVLETWIDPKDLSVYTLAIAKKE
ncbi:MAG: hypothetical protein LBO67_05585 [Spirochaetaceae bacterium]|jgi:hypothetical protein|nr:hypothetical protein [Spirochaetaceae bacterium]